MTLLSRWKDISKLSKTSQGSCPSIFVLHSFLIIIRENCQACNARGRATRIRNRMETRGGTNSTHVSPTTRAISSTARQTYQRRINFPCPPRITPRWNADLKPAGWDEYGLLYRGIRILTLDPFNRGVPIKIAPILNVDAFDSIRKW